MRKYIMIYRLLRPLGMFVLLIGMLAIALPQHAHASLPTPSSSVFPQEVTAGSMVGFTATGFRSERVGYWFNAPDGSIHSNNYRYAAYAFESQIKWMWQVPHHAPPGTWTAVARGEESGVQVVIPFVVTPPPQQMDLTPSPALPPNPPHLAVEPLVGPPGTSFTFSAPGLDGERVGYWFHSPDGALYADDERYWFKTDLDPVTWSWKAPPYAANGVWKVVARGEESQIQHEIFFEVREPPYVPPPETVPVNQPCLSAVEPGVGYPNTEFHFFSTGFPPRSAIRYWAEDPNGRKYDYDPAHAIGSNPNGRVDIQWSAPDNAMHGFWTMHFLSEATGENPSHIERLVYFEVQQPDNPLRPPPPPSADEPSTRCRYLP